MDIIVWGKPENLPTLEKSAKLVDFIVLYEGTHFEKGIILN